MISVYNIYILQSAIPVNSIVWKQYVNIPS